MSAAESKAAVDRVAAKRKELGAYAFLALGGLAHQAPEVVQFVLDQADALTSGDGPTP
jgi:hypothetical protein